MCNGIVVDLSNFFWLLLHSRLLKKYVIHEDHNLVTFALKQ